MQMPKCFFIAAQLLALPSVKAMLEPNEETIDKMLKGEPGYSVHDVPDEDVEGFLHPLLRRGGGKLVQEVIDRRAGNPERDSIETLVDAETKKVFPRELVKDIVEYVMGSPIEGLDLETADDQGRTLLREAVL